MQTVTLVIPILLQSVRYAQQTGFSTQPTIYALKTAILHFLPILHPEFVKIVDPTVRLALRTLFVHCA